MTHKKRTAPSSRPHSNALCSNRELPTDCCVILDSITGGVFAVDRALRAVDEVVYRTWRLYMSGSAHGFETGRINVYQVLLAQPERGRSGLPLTRADWYH